MGDLRRSRGSGGFIAVKQAGALPSALPRSDEPHSERTTQLATFTPGTVVAGKFTLQRVIAAGGMGTVFEAWDTFIERRVALKLMHPNLVDDKTAVARFRREAQATARVRHPNVVDVLEVGMRRDGAFYMVQELLTGKTVKEVVSAKKLLSPEQALGISIPIMGALSAAHVMGIVHRDIKPDNIVLTTSTSGEIVPKIIDFGVAKVAREANRQSITQLGTILGTPYYMAPEQVTGDAVDARADVWSLAVVLFEMLSGARPYTGESGILVMTNILTRPPLPFDVVAPPESKRFGPVLERAMTREVEKRFPTMAAFRDALLEAAGGQLRPIFANELLGGPTGRSIPAPPIDDMPFSEMDPEEITVEIAQEIDEDEDEHSGRATISGSPSAPRLSVVPPQKLKEMLARAERALDVNALEDAIHCAEEGLNSKEPDDDFCRGRLWLVSAIAHRWQGDLVETMRASQEALSRLARGSEDWHSALDHAVIAHGYLGRRDRLLARVDDLRALEEEGEIVSPDAFVVSSCRLAYFILRAGVPKLAAQLTRKARQMAEQMGTSGPFAKAWIDIARAELALYDGDLASHLRRLESAVETFTSAQDVRHACFTRAAIGRAYLSLGAKEHAASILHGVLSVAEPMALDFVPATRAAFGFALALLGRVDEGGDLAAVAVTESQKRANPDVESSCLLYLARIRKMQSDPEAALSLARKAVDASAELPGRRAYALAFLANVFLGRGQFEPALKAAVEAQSILDRIGGVEEGEPLIRLIHALVLRATGKEAEGRKRILEARKRLYEIAACLGDARWQKSFSTGVPDNARLLSVAEQWVGSATS